MPDAAMQARVQELNAKMEGQAKVTFDEIERKNLRKIARKSYACVVSCFDKAGTKGSPEALQACSKNCQLPYQQANAIVNDEAQQFQNRLHRAMTECQDQARDMFRPGMDNDPSKIAKLEESLLQCMSKTVDQRIKLLSPMKQRIESQIKQFN